MWPIHQGVVLFYICVSVDKTNVSYMRENTHKELRKIPIVIFLVLNESLLHTVDYFNKHNVREL